MSWQSLTTRRGNKPKFVGGAGRGRPRKVMARNEKDAEQDKQISNVKKHIRTIDKKQELKHVDILWSTTADTGSAAQLLNGLTQGTSNITRQADLVSFTSIQCRGAIILDTNSLVSGAIRLIVVIDSSPNGAAMGITNLLDNSVITNLFESPYNSDYFKRFKILHDKVYVINQKAVAGYTLATGVTNSYQPARVYVKWRKQLSRQSNYGLGNGGTITDISKNAYYAFVMSNVAAGNSPPTTQFGFRMYYKDD